MFEYIILLCLRFNKSGSDTYSKMSGSQKEKMNSVVFWISLLAYILILHLAPMPYEPILRLWFDFSILFIALKTVFTGEPVVNLNGIFLKLLFFPFILFSFVGLYVYLRIKKNKYGSGAD